MRMKAANIAGAARPRVRRRSSRKTRTAGAALDPGFVPHPLAGLGKAGIDETRRLLFSLHTHGRNRSAKRLADHIGAEKTARRARRALRRWEKDHLLNLVSGIPGVEFSAEFFLAYGSLSRRKSSMTPIDFRPLVALLAAMAGDARVWANGGIGFAHFGSGYSAEYCEGSERGPGMAVGFGNEAAFDGLERSLRRWRGIERFFFRIRLLQPSAHARLAILRRAKDVGAAPARAARGAGRRK